MKRFYADARIAAAEGGYSLLLDGRPVKTPARKALRAPNRPLAEAAAEEWQRQGDEIDAGAMPFNRFLNTALDRVAERESEVVSELAAYAATDLVSYRADQPEDLAARQAAAWDPALDWLARTHGAKLTVTTGIAPVDQPPEALAVVRNAFAAHDAFALAGLHSAVSVLGSAVLGLAFAEGPLDAQTAFDAAMVDETYQTEQWGEDAEAAKRRASLRQELDEAAAYLRLLSQ